MVLNLYRHIDRDRIQFDIVIDRPEDLQLAAEFEKLGSKIYVMPSFNGYNFLEIRRCWRKFFDEHSEYEVMHSHVRSYAMLFLPIAKRFGIKTIIHSHSTLNGQGFSALVKRIMQFPLRYQADYLLACSNEAGRWLYGVKACNKPNYKFIPNAIDIQQYHFSEEARQAYRAELGVQDRFVIGHVGRFHEAKNHMFLLEVFAEVLKRRSDAMLVLVGDGDLRSAIEHRIDELQIADHVILTGSRGDVAQLMSAMDVFAFPSIWEGLPVTVVEAQASGLHCLISDRITNDVDTSELVERLPITNTAVWVERMVHLDTERVDVTQKIREAGFDVRDSARRMMDFYEMMDAQNE